MSYLECSVRCNGANTLSVQLAQWKNYYDLSGCDGW